MRTVPLILALALGLLGAAAPRPALAADVYGSWQSTSGNVFEITGSRRGGFKLRVTYPNGTQTVLRGDWVPGMVGVQFNYWDANTQYTATFNPRDPDRVRVVYGRGVTSWWKRYSHTVAVPAHSSSWSALPASLTRFWMRRVGTAKAPG